MNKMFWVFPLVALMLCSSIKASSVSNSGVSQFALLKIELAFTVDRCLRNADFFKLLGLKAEIVNFSNWILNNVKPPSSDEELINILCTTLPQDGYCSMENVLKKLKPCLDLKEKYLPELLLNFHNNAFEYSCNNNATNLQDFVSTVRSADCDNPIEDIQEVLTERCFVNSPLLKNLGDPNYILTKSDLCQDLETAKDCAIEEVQSHCDNAHLMEVLTRHIDQLLIPCDN